MYGAEQLSARVVVGDCFRVCSLGRHPSKRVNFPAWDFVMQRIDKHNARVMVDVTLPLTPDSMFLGSIYPLDVLQALGKRFVLMSQDEAERVAMVIALGGGPATPDGWLD